MDSRIIKYSAEQIEQACQTESFVCITFHDKWCGVADVIMKKITEKCIWPQNTNQARVEKEYIGCMNWSNLIVIKGDENQAIDTYYSRIIEVKQEEIRLAQEKIDLAQAVIQERIIAHLDPESRKWVR